MSVPIEGDSFRADDCRRLTRFAEGPRPRDHRLPRRGAAEGRTTGAVMSRLTPGPVAAPPRRVRCSLPLPVRLGQRVAPVERGLLALAEVAADQVAALLQKIVHVGGLALRRAGAVSY